MSAQLKKQSKYAILLASLSLTSTVSAATLADSTYDDVHFNIEVVASQLEVPWAMAFQGDTLFFTERPGRLKMILPGEKRPTLIAEIADVASVGEGGLMGLALHPRFRENRQLYLSMTYRAGDDNVQNKVVRYVLARNGLSEPTVIVDQIPGSSIHNGCRIRFGPDGKLYITTGDAGRRELAQDKHSLAGKILRVNDDGRVPSDNPNPRSPVYSVGHRNPQGIDWHPDLGAMFCSEHGPSGFDGPGGGDEINLVEPGKNYGWPIIHHRERKEGLESPVLEYTPAIAPSGASFYWGVAFPQFRDNLFVATLRGRHLLRVVFSPKTLHDVVKTESLLDNQFGRLRDVVVGPDGFIYVSTSNRDGRANPSDWDDRIIRLVPLH